MDYGIYTKRRFEADTEMELNMDTGTLTVIHTMLHSPVVPFRHLRITDILPQVTLMKTLM